MRGPRTNPTPVPDSSTGCELFLGARGWDRGSWVDGFYPDDLPEDWRLAYYANAFRGVVIPSSLFASADPADFRAWRNDVHEAFRFVVELEVGKVSPEIAGDRLEPLEDALIGVVLGGPDDTMRFPAEAGTLLARIGGDVQVAAPAAWWGDGALAARLDEFDASPIWCSDRAGAKGGPGGWFGDLVELPDGPRAIRHTLEAFLAWSKGRDRAFLAFPGLAKASEAMTEARVIADLLGA